MGISLTQNLDRLVDGLADQGYAIIDNFLSPEEVDAILQLDEFNGELLQFQKAGIGKKADKQINESIRGDYIQWINPATAVPAIQAYLIKLNDLIKHVNQTLFLSLKDCEVHMTVYPVGSYYHRHLDQFRGNGNRKFTFILYLNFDWQPSHGGCLRMYLPQGDTEIAMDIAPQAGRLVCFKSDAIPHEVLPTHALRYSITGWWLEREKQLSFLG